MLVTLSQKNLVHIAFHLPTTADLNAASCSTNEHSIGGKRGGIEMAQGENIQSMSRHSSPAFDAPPPRFLPESSRIVLVKLNGTQPNLAGTFHRLRVKLLFDIILIQWWGTRKIHENYCQMSIFSWAAQQNCFQEEGTDPILK